MYTKKSWLLQTWRAKLSNIWFPFEKMIFHYFQKTCTCYTRLSVTFSAAPMHSYHTLLWGCHGYEGRIDCWVHDASVGGSPQQLAIINLIKHATIINSKLLLCSFQFSYLHFRDLSQTANVCIKFIVIFIFYIYLVCQLKHLSSEKNNKLTFIFCKKVHWNILTQ